MNNIFFVPESGIALLTWNTLLAKYTLSNCSVTLTNKGLRIYRPPNKNPTDNGNTMWGGMKIINATTSSISHTYDPAIDNYFNLIQGHTYIILFHVSGLSTNTFVNFGWTNQMGYSGRGLMPTPTNVLYHRIPTDFLGEEDCFYKFTLSDTISKVCTTTYSYATAGLSYLSYTHFLVGFEYLDTGALGTDLYITNLRMYDITNNDKNFSILKSGIIETNGIIERTNNLTSISYGKEIETFLLYEY